MTTAATFFPQVMPRKMAIVYAGHSNPSSFKDWCKRNGVTPCSHGRYAKVKIDLGLAREIARARK